MSFAGVSLKGCDTVWNYRYYTVRSYKSGVLRWISIQIQIEVKMKITTLKTASDTMWYSIWTSWQMHPALISFAKFLSLDEAWLYYIANES